MPNTIIHVAYLKFHQLSHLTFLLVVLGIILTLKKDLNYRVGGLVMEWGFGSKSVQCLSFKPALCVPVELALRTRLCSSLWPADSFLSVEAPLVNCFLFGRSPI